MGTAGHCGIALSHKALGVELAWIAELEGILSALREPCHTHDSWAQVRELEEEVEALQAIVDCRVMFRFRCKP